MNVGSIVIIGTGCYVPEVVIRNSDFGRNDFYTENFEKIDIPSIIIAEKLQRITGIEERRYVSSELTNSQIAAIAAERAIQNAGIDRETIDQIIFAHNFGNVIKNTIQMDAMPALASRVKQALGIKNPNCIPYDVLFGCPGWLQGLIQAEAFIKSGIAKKCLVIGSETLSRVLDHHDRDSMIFSDGAGACILEATEDKGRGILSSCVQSHCGEEVDYLFMGKSYCPDADPDVRYIKMRGKKVYEYAMRHVPDAMKECLDKSGVPIGELKKVFLHQANEKMDESMLKKMYQLYGINELPAHIMPMNIHKLGNSSVATIPTLFDMVRKGLLDYHSLLPGDVIMFASVGAGMNLNAICYRM